MAKQQASQKYIFKINSSRLRKSKWDLTLTLAEARKNDEIISLNDSQMLRWIDELNGVTDAEVRVSRIKTELKVAKKRPSSISGKRYIRQLYAELDEIQFKPDYMHLVVDKDKDLFRACEGFKINGIRYVRLLGTNGGVKCSTIVFVSDRLAPELRKRIDNGRNNDIPQIPAKLEAYRALTCSGSIPVSMPNGILVVKDAKTCFKEDVITLNDEADGEPVMEIVKDYEIELDESDGYGLILPSLCDRWSKELGLDYLASGMNTRCSWTKGMVFCFDFIDFADKIAGGNYVVKDAWGHDVDVRNVEMILTTSMLKLWACYDGIEHYLRCCAENHYTFGITKTCPKELENRRDLNYQFIQSLRLTDSQIDDLIGPTSDEIHDILSNDYRRTLLYLRGTKVTDDTAFTGPDDFVKALMIDERMFYDPYVRSKIYRMIRKRIDDAKIGVIGVHSNYSIACGDPYALAQSVFGLEVTGLLSAGEIFNRYWSDWGARKVGCFRAPMSTHENIKKLSIHRSEAADYWYQYLTTCTLFNAHDSCAAALNGMDKDGDLVFLTDDKTIVDNIRQTNTIFCAQRQAVKKVVDEEDLVKANIASFGDDIGKVTNRITAMFDLQAQFDQDSDEYSILDYRIKSGQLFQQNAIDKAKGIVCKPMPRSWYDAHSCRKEAEAAGIDPDEYIGMRLLADRKPYFMRYIYQDLAKQYNTYVRKAGIKCIREFRMDLSELLALPECDLTDEQMEFISYFKARLPVGDHDCVMNRICRRFEKEFDHYVIAHPSPVEFDYTILQSGAEYPLSQKYAIMKLHDDYVKQLERFCQDNELNLTTDEYAAQKDFMLRAFKSECMEICGDATQLCDIIVDICYRTNGTKQFAWDMCGDTMIENLLNRNGHVINYPVADQDGDIEFGGSRFTMKRKEVPVDGNCDE